MFSMEEEFKLAYNFIENNTILELVISEKAEGKIDGVYQDIEKKVSKVSGNRQAIRKSYFISVELIENVIKYGIFNGSNSNNFFLAYNNNRFYFLSGNLVDNKDVNFIMGKLENINLLFDTDNTKELLRKIYQDTLEEAGLSGDGVKLGIIDLARKLDNKILYNFDKISDKYSVFSIICTVDDK